MLNWEEGEPQPSVRERMLRVLQEQPERVWTPSEMRGELFPDVELPSPDETSDLKYMISRIAVAQKNAVAENHMEIFVEEGILDKREFRIDEVSELTVNEQEYEELIERWPDDEVYSDRTYYRLNKG